MRSTYPPQERNRHHRHAPNVYVSVAIEAMRKLSSLPQGDCTDKESCAGQRCLIRVSTSIATEFWSYCERDELTARAPSYMSYHLPSQVMSRSIEYTVDLYMRG
jgi:hypothetical protein